MYSGGRIVFGPEAAAVGEPAREFLHMGGELVGGDLLVLKTPVMSHLGKMAHR